MSSVFTKPCGARVFAVAITREDGDLRGYAEALEFGDVPVQYAMRRLNNIFVMWWYKDFPWVID